MMIEVVKTQREHWLALNTALFLDRLRVKVGTRREAILIKHSD